MGIHPRRLDLDDYYWSVGCSLRRSNLPGKPWSVSKNGSFFLFFIFLGGFEAGAATVLQFAVILRAHR